MLPPAPAQIAQLLTIKREREITEGVGKRASRQKDKCAARGPSLRLGLVAGRAVAVAAAFCPSYLCRSSALYGSSARPPAGIRAL